VALAGCSQINAALSKQWAVVNFKPDTTAGTLANIQTRAMNEGDHICRNEEVWYRPLTKLDHSMPAYALANQFQGKGLDTTWSNPDKRSAFLGTFVTASE